MFLTAEELNELTGYRRPKEQREWLRKNGYRFDPDRAGKPKVLRAQIEARQLGKAASERRTQPDFSAIV